MSNGTGWSFSGAGSGVLHSAGVVSVRRGWGLTPAGPRWCQPAPMDILQGRAVLLEHVLKKGQNAAQQ